MSRLADPELAERRRRQILEAALVCFRRRGFHQATMQEICSEAGISSGALYRYFASKADIIAAIAEDEQSQQLFTCGDFTACSAIDLMCHAARHFYEKTLTDEGGLLMADVFAEVARDALLARSLSTIDDRRIRMLAERIRAAQASGEADPSLDPTIAARTLCAAMEGIGFRHAWKKQTDIDEAAAQFRALAERYLARQSA